MCRWYDGECFYDSQPIIQMLNDRHPEPHLASWSREIVGTDSELRKDGKCYKL